MVSSSLVLVVVATLAPSSLSYPTYSAKFPNGGSFGKSLGHGDKGNYTPFGRLFRENGKSWAGVCQLPWPEQPSVSVGAAMGDPCCRWTGGSPDYVLSAPNPAGTVCGGGAGTGTGAAQPGASNGVAQTGNFNGAAPIGNFNAATAMGTRAVATQPFNVAAAQPGAFSGATQGMNPAAVTPAFRANTPVVATASSPQSPSLLQKLISKLFNRST